MHVDFDPLKVEWSSFANTSPEHVVQYGGYSVFRGMPYQRGNGLGSVFRHLMRYLVPIGKAIGRQGLETGNQVLSNVLEGKDLKESLVTESKAGLKNLLDKAASNLAAQKGQGFDFKRYAKENGGGGGRIGKAKRSAKGINKLQSTLGPTDFIPAKAKGKKAHKHSSNKLIKRFRKDILGNY